MFLGLPRVFCDAMIPRDGTSVGSVRISLLYIIVVFHMSFLRIPRKDSAEVSCNKRGNFAAGILLDHRCVELRCGV